VVQLDDGVGVVRFDPSGDSGSPFEVVVAVDTQLSGKADAFFLRGGRAGHRQAEPAFGALDQPAVLVIAQPAVGMALAVVIGASTNRFLRVPPRVRDSKSVSLVTQQLYRRLGIEHSPSPKRELPRNRRRRARLVS
jgi:hypothetical protein